MNRIFLGLSSLVLGASSIAAAMACQIPVPAAASAYVVEVLVDGQPLPTLAARGRTYIEARPDREYTVRLTNRTGERVAVALAIDGLNSIDAKTSTSFEASKWILGPYESITIDGWQTSATTARRFFFTTEERSYGEWLGKTKNLGVISAAFFRERERPQPAPYAESMRQNAPSARDEKSEGKRRQAPSESDALAATGIGRETDHRVVRVEFEPEPSPAQVVELRYEYRDALVQLGVLPQPRKRDDLARRERARGFEPGSFAPDPYRR
jgi:hypothetical protein